MRAQSPPPTPLGPSSPPHPTAPSAITKGAKHRIAILVIGSLLSTTTDNKSAGNTEVRFRELAYS
jgi:hypothetical protein